MSRLPAPVQARLVELKESLERVLGDELSCLLVYGSAALGFCALFGMLTSCGSGIRVV